MQSWKGTVIKASVSDGSEYKIHQMFKNGSYTGPKLNF
jgi:hypothetical protein